MTDLKTLLCGVCSKALPGCTCEDIDERLYNFNVWENKMIKRKYNRQEERIAGLLSICQFVKPEEKEPGNDEILMPWKGFRDKVFKDDNPGSVKSGTDSAVEDGPAPSA